MIDEIQVKNLALIRKAQLEPAKGLTVLTGETGAGKTALLSACQLLMGERADKTSVRDGESSLEVCGRFIGKAIAEGFLRAEQAEEREKEEDQSTRTIEPDSELDCDEAVVVRRVSADGRSRVSINGTLVSVGELATLVAPTIDLCGQHEHQQLMKSVNHLALLDAWARESLKEVKDAYRHAYIEASKAQEALDYVLEAKQASNAKLNEAQFVLQHIDEVNPQPGEYEELSLDLAKAEHSEALALAADTAHEALSGERGALDTLHDAISALEEGARFDDSLSSLVSSLREAGFLLEDVVQETRMYRDSIDFDPEVLNWQQERMSAMQGLIRVFGPRMDDVLAARNEAAELVSLVDDAAEREREARAQVEEAEKVLEEAAERLSEERLRVAPEFAQGVTAQMERLEMGSAELVCRLQTLPRSRWTPEGSQSGEFLFKPGHDIQARPLVRIASGGEMSRVMLAIKVVLGAQDDVETLVFDEVDAGVGGATANALAQVIADLAQTHQVLVVTHLAQLAVMADKHYLIHKTDDTYPETTLHEVEGEERVAEIARMLSGTVTEASLAHAREMIERAS